MSTNQLPPGAKNLRRLGHLYSGHDTGAYSLPAELITARGGLYAIGERMAGVTPPDPGQAERDYVTAVVAAANAGKPIPGADPVVSTEAAAAVYERTMRLLLVAAGRADDALAHLADDLADRIITDRLAPAVDELMAGVTAAAGKLPDNPTPETLLAAPDAARKAWFALADHAARYDQIRRAAAVLRRVQDTPKYDTHGRYAELHNTDELTVGMTLAPGGPRPWPEQTPLRLLWYVRHDGRVWLPTIEQMDARFYEVHGDHIRKMANAHARLGGTDRVAA